MANTSKIRGFIPVKHATGAPYNGQANTYATAAADGTAIFVGDPVKITSDGNAQGIQIVTKATAGAAVLGVCVGVINPKLDPVAGTMTNASIALDTPQYRAASTAQYILVADSPDLLFEVEAVTGSNAAYAFAVADIGLNADLSTVAGSTTTGTSAAALDMATNAVTATLQFKIMGVVQRPDNEITGNNTKVLVKFNNAQLGAGTGTLGIA
jgi:hypothetical protein